MIINIKKKILLFVSLCTSLIMNLNHLVWYKEERSKKKKNVLTEEEDRMILECFRDHNNFNRDLMVIISKM